MPNRRPTNHPADKCLQSPLRFQPSLFCLAITLAGAVAASTLTGCGLGTADTSASPLVTPPITGKLLGGITPVVGATVKMYATGNAGVSTGYGIATMLQEATQKGASLHQDTDSAGNFSFAGGYNCPAGQFAYMVASGGNSGGNSTNNNLVMVAAMGRCEDLYNLVGSNYTGYKGTPVYMNELSTIAAAYALGHFATVTGTGSSAVVSIGAPATNNAAQVAGVSTGCVAGVGSCTTTASAGLAHAFLNAATLVNVFTASGQGSNANATVPGNANGVVPRELINTIGNILISCVNSNGGVANDASACGTLFGSTTIGSNVPTNTFSAMVNLAANPTLGGSPSNVAALYNLALPASSTYQPSLSSTSGLNDFSIAINYPAANGFVYPYTGALDINDDYFVGNAAGSGVAPVNVLSFSSNGAALGATAGNTNLKFAYGMSIDALGNGYLGNGSGSGTNALGTFTFAGGVPSATLTNLSIASSAAANLLKVYATAVDKANNLWVFGPTNSGTFTNTLYMCPTGISSTSANCVGEAGSAGAANSSGGLLAIDPNQNVWTGFAASLAVLQNTGTVAAPTYPATIAAADTASTSPNPLIGVAFTGTASNPAAYVSGYKSGTLTGVQTINYTQSGVGVASITAGTDQFGGTVASSTVMTGAYGDAADGVGQVWVADFNDHAVFQTSPGATTPAAYKIIPCVGGVTPCATIFNSTPGTTKPSSIAVDSTGSIWTTAVFATSPYSGQVVQIIGSAAPTWPLLSLGKTGTP